MEQNVAILSKKICNMIRVAITMIKKGLCKKKILMDLNIMMKHGKIVGKALRNLMFHNHHHHNLHYLFAPQGGVGGPTNIPYDAREYEFSCSNTPLYQHYFASKRKNHQNNSQRYMPSPLPLEVGENINIEDVNNVLEMMLRNKQVTSGVSMGSPGLTGLGFGWSPGVRKLRVTDSPFPIQIVEGDKHVDKDAEDFINNFYTQLKQQIQGS